MENIDEIFAVALKWFADKAKSHRQFALKTLEEVITPDFLSKTFKSKKSPSDELKRRIAAKLDYPGAKYENFLNIGRDLLAGKEPSEPEPAPPPATRAVPEDELESDYHQIPFRDDMRLAAGSGEAPEGFYDIKSSPVVIHKSILKRHRAAKLMAFRIGGKSMEPTIMKNGIVVVDESMRDDWSRVKNKDIYMIGIDDAVAVKRLEWAKPGVVLAIISDNPAFATEYKDVDELRLFGRVIWSCQEY